MRRFLAALGEAAKLPLEHGDCTSRDGRTLMLMPLEVCAVFQQVVGTAPHTTQEVLGPALDNLSFVEEES